MTPIPRLTAGTRLALVCLSMLRLAGSCLGQTPSTRNDWTQFLNNDMRRSNPYEKILNVKNVAGLKVKWVYATRAEIGTVSPAVANGALYIFSMDNTLYALDASTGSTLWTFPTKYGGGSVAVENGTAYFSSDGVYALDARTGVAKWTFGEGDAFYGDPAVVDGVVYVGQVDGGNFYALDGETGATLWSYHTNQYSFCFPAVANGLVYANSNSNGLGNNTLWALDARKGDLVWSFATDPYSGTSAPAVANGLVYIPPDGGTHDLYALNARNGGSVWTYSFFGSSGVGSTPAMANGIVYTQDPYDGSMYALNARTGAVLWTYQDGYGSPAVANGVVYLSCSLGLCALDAQTGAQLWSFTARLRGFSDPVVANGIVYAGAGDRNIYAFSLK
jgi:outer membrane protein assembly factor BamB